MKTTRGSARALAGVAAGAALAVTGTLVAGAPAVSAEVERVDSGCVDPYPAGDLVAEQPVTGLTVSSGTTPEGFTGEVLGVLNDGIAPGLDMIMVRLASAEIDRVGGIWAGMSGSPVYAADGRLIGAVAYGLALGPSPVAGVTPFEDMNDYLTGTGAGVGTIEVSAKLARKLAAEPGVSEAEAASGFRRLPMPLGVSGLSADRLESITKKRYVVKNATPMGAAVDGEAAPGVEAIEAGGNLGVAISSGDITFGGVGTVTAVCADEVVGFGHPMAFLGATTLTLHPADAIYVQEDPTLYPFKVANLAPAVGTIDNDRLAAVTGGLGALPETMDITSTVAYADRDRTGNTGVSVPEYDAIVTLYQSLLNHDRVIDGYIAGSELQSWTITGERPDGSPFTLEVADRYQSSFDITWESVWDPADMVWVLGDMPGVKVNSVTMDSDVFDDETTYRVGKVHQRRGGEWQPVSRRRPIVASAGTTARLRVTLTHATEDSRQVTLALPIPQRAAGGQGAVSIEGGGSHWNSYWSADTVDELSKAVDSWVRNDQLIASMYIEGRRGTVEKRDTSDSVDRVVEGFTRVAVEVRP